MTDRDKKDSGEQPITEEDFIEALKKASRPIKDQEPVEETEDEEDEA